MATPEEIIERVRSPLQSEQRQLRLELDSELEERTTLDASESEYRNLERETVWLGAHRHEFLGQCVAVEGDILIAHGTDAWQVYLAARAAGIEVPFIEHVEKQEDAITGGWL